MKAPRAGCDLAGGIQGIWKARLGLDALPLEDGEPDPGRILIAVVRPAGEPRTGLVLECPAALARRAAAALRGTEARLLSVDDVEDALRELATAAGELIWSCRRRNRPQAAVVQDRRRRPRASERPRLRRAVFACEGYVFRVTVVG